jgi:hypothetical protein
MLDHFVEHRVVHVFRLVLYHHPRVAGLFLFAEGHADRKLDPVAAKVGVNARRDGFYLAKDAARTL